jgi:hypothetical protein
MRKVRVYFAIGSGRELLDTPSFMYYLLLFSAIDNKPVNEIEDFKTNSNFPKENPCPSCYPKSVNI